jgi:nitrate/nitrite transporter NarK
VCQQPAELNATSCLKCGHQYRTQFVAPQPTQAFHTPVATTNTVSDNLLEECAYQYKQHTQWYILAFLFVPCVLGLPFVLWIQSKDIQLRSKVAMLGIHAGIWEQQQKVYRNRVFWRFWLIYILLFLFFFTMNFLLALKSAEQETRENSTRNRYQRMPDWEVEMQRNKSAIFRNDSR